MTNDPPTFFLLSMFLWHAVRPVLWRERQSVTDQYISTLMSLMSTCNIIIAPSHLEIVHQFVYSPISFYYNRDYSTETQTTIPNPKKEKAEKKTTREANEPLS